MKKLISLVFLGLIFNGCTKYEDITNTPEINTTIVQKQEKIINPIKEIPLPYVKESKYIKILILPFENSENDIDYGGYIETKLESSKFIFNDTIKNKIIEDNTIGGI